MLGDIVPNNGGTVNAEAGAAPKPGGYGSSSFGTPRPAQPAYAAPAQPVTQTAAAPASSAIQNDVVPQADATPSDIAAVDPLSKQSGSKVPLVLTVVGVLVFVTGVSGLFMYALSGS